MTDKELMQLALDALEWCYDVTEWPANGDSAQDKAIDALRTRLAQPEREWQGLTDREIDELFLDHMEELFHGRDYDYERAIEAKLKEKNHG
jgi:hypothetical protein